MPIAFTCPQCGVKKQVPDHFAGQSGPCAECGQLVTIPGNPAPVRSASGGLWVVMETINAARDGTGLASGHSRGVNVAMADGSVIALTDATSLETLGRLVTKSDGAPIVLP